MKQFNIIGLCKREYRGKGRNTTLTEVVEADSKEAAEEKFEKANPEYNPAVVNELPKSKKAKDIRDDNRQTSDGPAATDSDIEDGRDIASEHDENG